MQSRVSLTREPLWKKLFRAFAFLSILTSRGAVARDREFNPMTGMEVLTHGETEVASLPSGIICCSVASVNVPISELHVTTVGSEHYPAYDGEKGLYTRIDRPPSSYSKYEFSTEEIFSEICNDSSDRLTASNLKSSTDTCTDQDKIDRVYSGKYKKFAQSGPKQAAFTFFGPNNSQKDKAVIQCWPLEEDVLVGALLERNRKYNG